MDPAEACSLFGLSVAEPSSPAELDEALAGEARAIVVRTDRQRNRELHRELSDLAETAARR
jgi:2-succinyl-5-enolpyruvyl-6-hydroxy-3-cyclohexene-1-carboxylate synthase